MLKVPDKTTVAESQLYSSCRFVQLQELLGRTRTVAATLQLPITRRGAWIKKDYYFMSTNFKTHSRNKNKVLPHDSRPAQKYKVQRHETGC